MGSVIKSIAAYVSSIVPKTSTPMITDEIDAGYAASTETPSCTMDRFLHDLSPVSSNDSWSPVNDKPIQRLKREWR